MEEKESEKKIICKVLLRKTNYLILENIMGK